MGSSNGEKAPSGDKKRTAFAVFLQKLRKRRIIETLAAFIGGGWLLVEVVERLLVGHYKFPDETIDLTVVSVIGALLSTLLWRWFRGTEKRPGNVKVEVLLVPLIILAVVAIDLDLILDITGVSGMGLLIGIVALGLSISWIIFKSLQWAAHVPHAVDQIPAAQVMSDAGCGTSIAVLPFEDMSPEKDQEYLCDGITEEIINALSHLDNLRVIARTSAFAFKGTRADVREIGKKLDVETLLEGSVRKTQNRLRITAQLISVHDGSHIWSERYDRNLEDVFAIQDEISIAIAERLRIRLDNSYNFGL